MNEWGWTEILASLSLAVSIMTILLVPIRMRVEMRERRRFDTLSSLIDRAADASILVHFLDGKMDTSKHLDAIRRSFFPFERLHILSRNLRERILVCQWELIAYYSTPPSSEGRLDEFLARMRDIQDAAAWEQRHPHREYKRPLRPASELGRELRNADEEKFGPIA